MDGLDAQLELTRRRDLLELRGYLDRRRRWEDEISSMKETLADPAYAIDHKAAKHRLEAATRLLDICNQLIAVQLEKLGIRDEKLELERQLAALEE
ncbi:hypothetical protein [Bradyrhizobium glycinis]|uniref:hypothetical protein n=1 Tax=Bradyrhizobium glycinis TaxID=2751812 RepID=UPI0018D97D9E|nr:hypothetical protein [Bradyrhizobium glycinis]MBH5373449.1 hypothetical protein [Bradyrhizobium glycinis]